MKADAVTEGEILAMLDNYASACAAKDVGRMMSHIAPDPDVIFVGSGRDEWVEGPEQLRQGFERDLAQADTIQITFKDVKVSGGGSVAWLACGLVYDVTVAGESVLLDGRFTATLERRDGEWLFVQSHYSLPNEGQEEGQSYPGAS
jgi:ketosteroid isomerase-like protein